MTTGEISRVKFYDGQYLSARDFEQLSKYFLELIRRQVATLHKPGVATGLTITHEKVTDNDLILYLESGICFDKYGRMLLVRSRMNLNALFQNRTGVKTKGPYRLWALYDKSEGADVLDERGLCEGDEGGRDRINEGVRLIFTPSDVSTTFTDTDDGPEYNGVVPPPDDPRFEAPVLLGEVFWNEREFFSSCNIANRLQVGVNAWQICAPNALVSLGSTRSQSSISASPGVPARHLAAAAGNGDQQTQEENCIPAPGQFRLSLSSDGTKYTDRILVDEAGNIRFDTPEFNLGVTVQSDDDPPVTQEKQCIKATYFDSEGKWVVVFYDDVVLREEVCFWDFENQLTTLKDIDKRIREIESIISERGAYDFLRYLSPQLAGILLQTAVAEGEDRGETGPKAPPLGTTPVTGVNPPPLSVATTPTPTPVVPPHTHSQVPTHQHTVPRITFSPRRGSPNSSVTINGDGFEPGESVDLYMDLQNHHLFIATVTAADGTFSHPWTIPNYIGGIIFVLAWGHQSSEAIGLLRFGT